MYRNIVSHLKRHGSLEIENYKSHLRRVYGRDRFYELWFNVLQEKGRESDVWVDSNSTVTLWLPRQ